MNTKRLQKLAGINEIKIQGVIDNKDIIRVYHFILVKLDENEDENLSELDEKFEELMIKFDSEFIPESSSIKELLSRLSKNQINQLYKELLEFSNQLKK